MDIKKIIKEYKTPLYVYDINELENRVNYLKDKLSKCKLVYAVKANTFIIKEIDSLVDKYEICSPGEFEICNKLNISYDKMVISGVNKDREFIDKLISNYEVGRYTIESMIHYELLSEIAKKYNKKINVLIRLTSGNQFGVSENDAKYIISNYDKNYISICGIEYFSGTQKHSIKRIDREMDHINEFIDSVKEEYNFKIDEVEYGPGLPVNYYQGDEFDEDEYFNELNTCLSKLKCDKVLIETGRSVVATCGKYLTSVVDMKTNKNGNFVIVDGGINHLVYYGSTLAMKVPYFEVLGNKKTKDVYNIYGSLCTTNDVLIKNVEIGKLSIGNTFVFNKVGAYSSTEGLSLFLSRDLPKIILYKDGKTKMVRDIINTYEINYPDYERTCEKWKN